LLLLRGLSNLLLSSTSSLYAIRTKLDSVQGLTRFGKLLHLPYAFELSTKASFADAKILVKGIHFGQDLAKERYSSV
jgi:hypothetical protein